MIEFIYAFGSITRGEIDRNSDIDILVITESDELKEMNKYHSYYKKTTLSNLWEEGNPFAWHLYNEAKLIYTYNGIDYISKLGKPKKYSNLIDDLENLYNIFMDAKESLLSDNTSMIFDYSTVFLVIRNVATCFELGVNNKFCFQRDSAINISSNKLEIENELYQVLRDCRVLSTRGLGTYPETKSLHRLKDKMNSIENWILQIKNEAYE
jgi:predicted nucleotidyltransferase